MRSYPLGEVARAVEQALNCGSVGVETVRYFLRAGMAQPHIPAAMFAAAPACPQVHDRDLTQYDLLLRR